MAHLHLHRPSKRSNSTPRTPKSPTIEQFLQGEASAWSGTASSTMLRDHDLELDHHQHQQKQSVLNRVKEKARRWRHSLSRKRHIDTMNATPSWGVSLEEDGCREQDPENLGAPMSESKMAPEGHKETARQHPRSNPLTPEKQTLHGSIREQPTVPRQGKDKQNHSSASDTSNNNKTFTSTVTEKLAPAYNAVSDATTAITSKIQNISVGGDPAQSPSPAQASSSPASSPTTTEQSPKFYDAPVSSSAPEKCPEGAGEETSPGKQIWEKGVSMKEYLMQKLEPGDDERALSQVISDAISPKRAPGDAGVVGKVKEAVTSLLRKDDSFTLWKSSSSQDPASSSLREEAKKDKSHGRVLQTN